MPLNNAYLQLLPQTLSLTLALLVPVFSIQTHVANPVWLFEDSERALEAFNPQEYEVAG